MNKEEIKKEWLTESISSDPIEILKDIQLAFDTNDFLRFAKYIVIVPEGSTKSINLAWENLFIEQQQFCLNRTGHDIVVKPRRVGFSTIEIARDLFHCLANRSQSVLLVAQQHTTAKNLLQVSKTMYESLSDFISTILNERKLPFSLNPFPELDGRKRKIKNTEVEIRFPNGSTFRALSAGNHGANAGRSLRGQSASRIHVTELAHWTNQTPTWNALVPLIKPEIEIVIESTPLNQFDKFHETYLEAKKASSDFKAHFYKWTEHKEYQLTLRAGQRASIKPMNLAETDMVLMHQISKEQLHFFQNKVKHFGSLEAALAEFPCDDETCFLASAMVQAGERFLSDATVQWLKGIATDRCVDIFQCGQVPLRCIEAPQPGVEYAMGVDVAEGRGGDNTACCIVRLDNSQIVAMGYHQYVLQEDWGLAIDDMRKTYNNAWLTVEYPSGKLLHNSCVEYDDTRLYEGKWANKYVPGSWHSSEYSRMAMFNNLTRVLEEKIPLNLPLKLANELMGLYWETDNKCSALGKTKKGKKKPNSPMDDCAIAYAIALYTAKEIAALLSVKQGISEGPALMLSKFSRGNKSQIPNSSRNIMTNNNRRSSSGYYTNSSDAMDAIVANKRRNKNRSLF